MVAIAQVRVGKWRRIKFFDAQSLRLRPGDWCIVEGEKESQYGEIVSVANFPQELPVPLKRILRLASPEDRRKIESQKGKEMEAFQICEERIKAHGLPMKLVEVESSFDHRRMTFYFTAEGRVDFRKLVKDLAKIFRAKIVLRQIGPRDKARMYGGCGSCGMPLCCSAFLREFEPVTIQMAKEQQLSLDPIKISGLCGRLMCCLIYESKIYRELRKRLPRIGSQVVLPQGRAKVVGINVHRESIIVELENGKKVDVLPSELVRPKPAFRFVKGQMIAKGR